MMHDIMMDTAIKRLFVYACVLMNGYNISVDDSNENDDQGMYRYVIYMDQGDRSSGCGEWFMLHE
jgi:hypothetical protein